MENLTTTVSFDVTTNANRTSVNPTNEDLPLFAKLTVAFQIVVMIVIVAGNGLVLVAVFRFRRLRDITGIFVANLATADLITGLSLPFQMAFFFHPEMERDRITCLLRYTVISFACNASAYSLLCTVIDRYIAIAHPFEYVRIMTEKFAYFLIVIIWIIDLVISLIPLFGAHNWETAPMCLYEIVIDKYFRLFNSVHHMIIAFIISFIYLRIFFIVRSQLRRIAAEAVFNTGDTTNRPSKQMNRIVGMVVLCFQVSWMPFFIIQLMLIEEVTVTKVLIANFLVFLGILNSTMNPFLYAWKNKMFRHAFRKLLRFPVDRHDTEMTLTVSVIGQ